jgi:hypothetical protein
VALVRLYGVGKTLSLYRTRITQFFSDLGSHLARFRVRKIFGKKEFWVIFTRHAADRVYLSQELQIIRRKKSAGSHKVRLTKKGKNGRI